MIIDGKSVATALREHIAAAVSNLKTDHGLIPCVAVILVGDDPASQVYVRNKVRQTDEVGMKSVEFRMTAETTQAQLLARVTALNNDPDVHGILVQLPLPSHIDERAVIQAIVPQKDVDGFHSVNVGKLANGDQDALVPCTPQGCIVLLKQQLGSDLSGKHAVVVGRSNIVGKPVAALLLQEHCTVTMTHSRTRDLAALCRQADILIAAVGRPQMIQIEWVKPGATVIDVGINRIANGAGASRLVGDVDFTAVCEVAGAITPVPGGVGPMTIACLLRNTLIACCQQKQISSQHLAVDDAFIRVGLKRSKEELIEGKQRF